MTAIVHPLRLNGVYTNQSDISDNKKAVPEAKAIRAASESRADNKAPASIADKIHHLPPFSWSKSLKLNARPAK